jgi:hypothetical protein
MQGGGIRTAHGRTLRRRLSVRFLGYGATGCIEGALRSEGLNSPFRVPCLVRDESRSHDFSLARNQVPNDNPQLHGSMSEKSDALLSPPALSGKRILGSLDEILTLEECAAWLVLKPRDLLEKVRAGRIPAIRLNKRVLRFHPRTVLLKLGVPSEAVGMAKNRELVRNSPFRSSV